MRTSRLALFDGLQLQDSPGCQAPDRVTLVKFGPNAFTKGSERGEFVFTGDDAEMVIAEFAARGRDLVIDYEHQTLSGAKAPAAGWIERLEKSADGLVAKVKYWTEEAKRLLAAGEYRYFSPVLHFSRSGRRVSAIHSVALTNHPALHQVPALVADDAADEASPGLAFQNEERNEKECVPMDELLKRLGLLALADAGGQEKADAVLREVDALLKLKEDFEKFLKLHDLGSLEELEESLRDGVGAEERERLEKELRERDAEAAVAKAFYDGKLAERSRAWAVAFAERDLAAFKDWSENAPRVVPDNEVAAAGRKPRGDRDLDETELKVFRALGLSEGQIEKLNEKEA